MLDGMNSFNLGTRAADHAGITPVQMQAAESGKGLCMAESGLARPTAATRAAFGIPSSIVGGMVARA